MGGARWREPDSLWGVCCGDPEGAVQTPPALAARALAHARSARWRAVSFPERGTSATLAGGGASWNARADGFPGGVVRRTRGQGWAVLSHAVGFPPRSARGGVG